MIQADFYQKKGNPFRFRISGHSGYAEAGNDVVCAAVSSAVQLTVNMLFVFDCEPKASAVNNAVVCEVCENTSASERILRQLMLHLESVSAEFPKTIKITISEV